MSDSNSHNDELEQLAQQSFLREQANLDGDTRAALDAMRQRAIAQARPVTDSSGFRFGWPFGGAQWVVATAAALVAVVALWPGITGDTEPASVALVEESDDLLIWEMLLAEEDTEFYQSLAFIEWLDDEAASTPVES